MTHLVVMRNGEALHVRLQRRRRRRRNPGGALARFSGVRWKPLSLGRKDGVNRWHPDLSKLQKGNASGVYVLRDKGSGEVVYVGESHTGRLYRTMLRHFHDGSGKFARLGEWVHHAPTRLEFKVFETAPGEALDLERDAVEYFEPVVNRLLQPAPDDGETPF